MPVALPSAEEFHLLTQRVAALETLLNAQSTAPLAVEYVSTDQACQILRCSRPTLLKLREAGRVTASWVGTRPRYALAALRAYLASRHVTEEAIVALVARGVK